MVKAGEKWNQSKSANDIRIFLGLVGYYQIFIEFFSKISLPPTNLTRKGVKYEGAKDCEMTF